MLTASLPLPSAAANDSAALAAQVQALVQRVERLETQNAELRAALESERISDAEPELATRLKAVEAQQQALQGPASTTLPIGKSTGSLHVMAVSPMRAAGLPLIMTVVLPIMILP